jgi:hypothetical protein
MGHGLLSPSKIMSVSQMRVCSANVARVLKKSHISYCKAEKKEHQSVIVDFLSKIALLLGRAAV